MKKLSRVLAVILAVLMFTTAFVGCHGKDEIAFTIGDAQYTSGMYSCVLFMSASNARSAIDTYIKDNEIKVETVDYSSYKFDDEGKVSTTGTISYDDFVKTGAIRLLKEYTVLNAWMKDKNLELDEDTLASIEIEAQSQWYYGCDYNTYYQYASQGMDSYLSQYYTPYGLYLEENGVAFSTFLKYLTYESTYNFYFNDLYGEGGEKEVPKKDITEFMTAHYVIADTISFSKKDDTDKELSDEKLKELKALADSYAERLNKGEKFEDIYKEEQARLEKEQNKNNSSNASTSASSENASSENTSSSTVSSGEKEYTPAEYTRVFGDKESNAEYAMFDDIKKQEVGNAVVLEDKENSEYLLIVKGDILAEEYWFKNLRSNITFSLKQEEFDKALKTACDALKVEEDTHATAPFDVKDVKFEIDE